MATGEKPYGEPTTTAGMKRRLYQEPRPLGEVDPKMPRWLQAIIGRCLKVEPHMRYASAESLLLDLQHPEQVNIGVLAEPAKPGVGGFLSRLFSEDITKRVAQSSRRVARAERAQTVLVAVDLEQGVDRLAEEVRAEAARIVAARPGSRLACLTVLKTEIIGGDRFVNDEGRSVYVSRLVALKDWARPFQRGDDAIAFHVIEAVSAANAILTYARENDVGHIVLGARSSSALRRHLGSVSSQVVAEAQCSVSVVRVKRWRRRWAAQPRTRSDGFDAQRGAGARLAPRMRVAAVSPCTRARAASSTAVAPAFDQGQMAQETRISAATTIAAAAHRPTKAPARRSRHSRHTDEEGRAGR